MKEGERGESKKEGEREKDIYVLYMYMYKDILHVQCTHYMLVTCKY